MSHQKYVNESQTSRETAGQPDSCPMHLLGDDPVHVWDTQTLLLHLRLRWEKAGRNMKSSGKRGQERQVYSREEKLEQRMGENQEDKNNQGFYTSSRALRVYSKHQAQRFIKITRKAASVLAAHLPSRAGHALLVSLLLGKPGREVWSLRNNEESLLQV